MRAKPDTLEEFHYQISWRSHSAIPGHHHSTQSGGGYEFHGHAPLLSNPQPRNLDIHASLHDPFGQFVVRTFRQSSSIPVYVIADLSASMGFNGSKGKMQVLTQFVEAAAYSTYRTGDPFGFIGCSDKIHWQLSHPLRWNKTSPMQLIDRLKRFQPNRPSADGLLHVQDYISRHRSLLFLVSDFHFPLKTLTVILDHLAPHDVIPVVLWNSLESRVPKWGIARLKDPESGVQRCLFFRPRLQKAFFEAFEQRHRDIIHTCIPYGRTPFFVIDQFNPEALTRYFWG